MAIDDEGTGAGATVRVFGGFNGVALANASPALRRRAALADLEHERETQAERKAAAMEAEAEWERNVHRLAIEAVEDGRIDSVVQGLRHPELLGRTRAEVVEQVWSYWDAYDARLARASQKAYAQWLEAQGTAWDSSAPSAAEVSAAEADRLLEDQRLLQRCRKIGEQREFRAQAQRMREIAQEEIAVDRADPRPINALLARAQRRGGRHG